MNDLYNETVSETLTFYPFCEVSHRRSTDLYLTYELYKEKRGRDKILYFMRTTERGSHRHFILSLFTIVYIP